MKPAPAQAGRIPSKPGARAAARGASGRRVRTRRSADAAQTSSRAGQAGRARRRPARAQLRAGGSATASARIARPRTRDAALPRASGKPGRPASRAGSATAPARAGPRARAAGPRTRAPRITPTRAQCGRPPERRSRAHGKRDRAPRISGGKPSRKHDDAPSEGRRAATRGTRGQDRVPRGAARQRDRPKSPRKRPAPAAAKAVKRCGSSAAVSRAAFSRRRRRAPSVRLRSACASRSSTFSTTASPVPSKARAWSTCSPDRGPWAIEALSRGARFALFVDNGAEARAVLRANVEALALGGVTRIWRADATKLGSAPAGGPFALAFLDPPYGQGLAGPALASLVEGGWLEPSALCVVEEAAKADIAATGGSRPRRRANLWRYADRDLSRRPRQRTI